ncbi:Nub1 [Symbiodinium sp. CCMP2592]|nr:Nub1 [Symbiodinium sp. CCMP2592]
MQMPVKSQRLEGKSVVEGVERSESHTTVLEELRQHALTKLQAKAASVATPQASGYASPKSSGDIVTLLGKVLGACPTQHREVRLQVRCSQTGEEIRQQLCNELGLSSVKVIAGGKNLQDGATLSAQGWCADPASGVVRVLLLAGPPAPSKPAATAQPKAAAQPSAASDPMTDDDCCTIAQLREAAERLTAEGFGDFELSDASTGRLVAVPPGARQALVTAIALHARGRELLAEEDVGAMKAVEFLVEASSCFDRCREQGAADIMDKLANYGQLQLDICWAYALLGDASYLPDAEARLQVAERMIRRQVDKNFLTLAEVKAEQGATLPPEVLPSVRLWLLRGVAKAGRGSVAAAREDLRRAALFIQALQVDETAVASLLSLGATRLQAVAALRRCEGSADRAADDILAASSQRKVAKQERRAQREYGLTNSGVFVDPDAVRQMVSMGIDETAALNALKQSNNDVMGALEEIQRKRLKQEVTVDDLALASLLSMGFEQSAAEAALREVGGEDVEAACAKLAAAPAPAGAETSKVDEANMANAPAQTEGATDDRAVKAAAALLGIAAVAAAAKAGQVAAGKDAAYEAARELVERELGQCLTRADTEDEVAGAPLVEEQVLLQRYVSFLEAL